MGVFSKLKGIFYDEVIVEEPEEELSKVDKIVKKEVVVEEPKKEEIKPKFDSFEELKEAKEEAPRTERELFRSERTFNFTEFDEEEELPPRKTVLTVERERERERKETRIPRSTEPVVPVVPEKPKVFKPSPIISPVYGILDKDYRKDEIKSKNIVKSEPVRSKVTTYDTVRRKAYGTLEDDLEDSLNSMESEVIVEEVSTYNNDNYTQTIEDRASRIEELINKIDDVEEELDKTMSVGELEDNVELENFEEVSDKTMTDSSLEHDLFNLIDSMYDDKED